nr:hypothetical protein [Microbispora sp. CSR-4]
MYERAVRIGDRDTAGCVPGHGQRDRRPIRRRTRPSGPPPSDDAARSDARTAAKPYSVIRRSYSPIAAVRDAPEDTAARSVRQGSAASSSAQFAPEPWAGLIAWTASPSTVTADASHGATGTELLIGTQEVWSTSAASIQPHQGRVPAHDALGHEAVQVSGAAGRQLGIGAGQQGGGHGERPHHVVAPPARIQTRPQPGRRPCRILSQAHEPERQAQPARPYGHGSPASRDGSSSATSSVSGVLP